MSRRRTEDEVAVLSGMLAAAGVDPAAATGEDEEGQYIDVSTRAALVERWRAIERRSREGPEGSAGRAPEHEES